jgi:predicted TIM-barrel fold metal-dependent hydrolase
VRIDVHNHIFPKELTKRLEKRSEYPFARPGNGRLGLHCCDNLTIQNFESFADMGKKLEDMDRVGVDVCILTVNLPGPELAMKPAEADELARIANDGVAEAVALHPKRFWGMASLGYGTIDGSLKELDRCVSQLKFRGLQMFSNIKGKALDDPELRPIFARMAELKRPIFMHPTAPLNRNSLMQLVPVPALGFIYDTTLAAVRLTLSGRLAEFPDLPLIVPHVGGVLPYLMERIVGLIPGYGTGNQESNPRQIFKRLYMDTVTYEPGPLKLCLETMGASQLLLGTDHPHGPWDRPTKLLDQVECSKEDREAMMHGNAERLFRPA